MSIFKNIRNVAKSFIIKAIRMGVSAAETASTLIKHGLGYALKEIYEDIKQITFEVKKWASMKFLKQYQLVPEELYSKGLKNIKSKFLTVFKITVEDTETKKRTTQYISVTHDHPMRRIDLERRVREAIEKDPESYGISAPKKYKIIDVDIEAGYARD